MSVSIAWWTLLKTEISLAAIYIEDDRTVLEIFSIYALFIANYGLLVASAPWSVIVLLFIEEQLKTNYIIGGLRWK